MELLDAVNEQQTPVVEPLGVSAHVSGDDQFALPEWPPQTTDQTGSWELIFGTDPRDSCGTKSVSPSSPKPSTGTPKMRSSPARLPRKAVCLLEEWLLHHSESPYAREQELDELKARTGLKRSQIRNWLSNARKRGKIQALRPSPSTTYLNSATVSLSLSPSSQWAMTHPFERWLQSGPDHEAASPGAIYQALITAQAHRCSRDSLSASSTVGSGQCQGTSSNWQYFRQGVSSVSSLEIRSYAANVKSVCSDQWKHPDEPARPLTRRHRRQEVRSSYSAASVDGKRLPRFQCTFCTNCFMRKHDWQRHEKSQHLPLEKWVCCPQGSVNVNPVTNEITCVFCGTPDPNPDHIMAHGYARCMSRPTAERAFYRKDHLRQHLRLMHHGCPMLPSMEAWKSVAAELRSRCGFCDAEFSTWAARVAHLSDHFHAGARMENWVGDWGFDQEVMDMLERATLPAKQPLTKNQPLEAQESGDLSSVNAKDRSELGETEIWGGNDATLKQIPAGIDQQTWSDFGRSRSLYSSAMCPLESLDSLDSVTFYGESVLLSDDGFSSCWFDEGVQPNATQQPGFAFSVPESYLNSTSVSSTLAMNNTLEPVGALCLGGIAGMVEDSSFPDHCLGDDFFLHPLDNQLLYSGS